MISRSSFGTVCFVILVAASLPAGAYSSASNSGSAANTPFEAVDDPYKSSCPGLAEDLEDTRMNVTQQDATNLRTESSTVSSTGNGSTTVEGLIKITTEEIHTNETCFVRPWEANETMMVTLTDVEFENTTLRGPWTNIRFEHGEADLMILVLPGREFLKTLKQSQRGELIFDSMKEYFELSSNVSVESDTMGAGIDVSPAESDEEDTRGSDDSADNETPPDDSAGNETPPGDSDENATNASDGTEEETTATIGSNLEAAKPDTEPSRTETVPRSPAATPAAAVPATVVSRRVDTATESTDTAGDS